MAQAAEPTSLGDAVFTDANFGGTPKAAIFFASDAIANDTSAASSFFRFGFSAGAAQAALGVAALDARTSANNTLTRSHFSSSYATLKPITGDVPGTPTTEATCAFSANTATLTYTDVNNAALMNCLLLGGDIEPKVISGVFPTGAPNNLTLSHSLSGAPEVIIFFQGPHTSDNSGPGVASCAIGFWDGTNLSAIFFANQSNAATTALKLFVSNTGLPNNETQSNKVTIGSVSSTQVVFNNSDTAAATWIYALCLRGTTSPLVAKTGLAASPTSPGAAAIVSGMSVAPKALLVIGTAAPAVNTSYIDDNAASLGFGAACSNAGGTKQMAAAIISDDGIALGNPTPVSSEHSWVHSDRFLHQRTTGDSGISLSSAIATWDSGGVSGSWDTVSGTSRQIPYLLIGQGTGVAPANKLVGKFGAPFRGKLAA